MEFWKFGKIVDDKLLVLIAPDFVVGDESMIELEELRGFVCRFFCLVFVL